MTDKIIAFLKKISIFDNFLFTRVAKKLLKDKIVFIDIGAAGGVISRWKKIEPHLSTVAFEPDNESFSKLVKFKKKNSKIFNIALSDKKGLKDFYICNDSEKSSFYKPNYGLLKNYPNPRRYGIKKKIKFKVNKLDNIGNFKPDFIKIDTQGSELEILKGSKKNLIRCIGLEVEVEFQEIYKNQKLFSEIFIFLEKNGFKFIDFAEKTYWNYKNTSKLGQNLVFANALFLKNDLLIKKFTNKEIKKYILIALLYNKVNLIENIINKMNIYQKKNIKQDLMFFFIRASFISGIKKIFNFLIKLFGIELSNNNIN